MTRDGEPLSTERLRELLDELSTELASQGERAQLFVVGGAAMALAYDESRTTRDVDALFEPKGQVRELAARLGGRHGLDEDWLNDAAKGFMPGADGAPRTVYESESLLVQVPSPEYMLAMKLHASRGERDLEDAAKLANISGITTPREGVELLGRMYPVSMLLPRHRYVVDDVMARAAAARGGSESEREQGRPTTAPPDPPALPTRGPSGPTI